MILAPDPTYPKPNESSSYSSFSIHFEIILSPNLISQLPIIYFRAFLIFPIRAMCPTHLIHHCSEQKGECELIKVMLSLDLIKHRAMKMYGEI
jgi:hypothetical protein